MDRFPFVVGGAALAFAPVAFAMGSAFWVVLALAGVVLVGSCVATRDEFELLRPTAANTAIALIGIACLVLALIYVARDADALPRLLPGHDGDSERGHLGAGVLLALVGAVLVTRSAMEVRFRRRSHLAR